MQIALLASVFGRQSACLDLPHQHRRLRSGFPFCGPRAASTIGMMCRVVSSLKILTAPSESLFRAQQQGSVEAKRLLCFDPLWPLETLDKHWQIFRIVHIASQVCQARNGRCRKVRFHGRQGALQRFQSAEGTRANSLQAFPVSIHIACAFLWLCLICEATLTRLGFLFISACPS